MISLWFTEGNADEAWFTEQSNGQVVARKNS